MRGSVSDLPRVLKRFASHNVGLKFLALGLAIVAWWFVAGESKVLVGFNVPLEIRDVPKGLTVINKVERQVEVRVSGPASLLSGLRPSDISASIDLSGGRLGRQYITLDDRTVKVPAGTTVQRIFPSAVEVVLEKTVRRVFPVVARIGGGPAVRKRIAKIAIVPPEVEVEALPDELSKMSSVSTEEILPDTDTQTYTTTARLELREMHARIVGVTNVRVTITFRKGGAGG